MGKSNNSFFTSQIVSKTHKKFEQQENTEPTISKNASKEPQDITHDVQSTWQMPQTDKSHLWERQTSHRDRISKPNQKGGYGRGRNKFYTLPYETRDELKNERKKAQKDAPLERIPEDTELNHASRFMKFNDESSTIDKNHIIGIHKKKDIRAQSVSRRSIMPEHLTRSGTNQWTIGMTRVSQIPLRKSQSDDSFFTEQVGMRRSSSFKNNLNNLANEQNSESEKPSHEEKIKLERSQSEPDIVFNWGTFLR